MTARGSLACALALVLGLLCAGPAAAADGRPSREVRTQLSRGVDALVEQRMAAHAIPGAAVAVIDGD